VPGVYPVWVHNNMKISWRAVELSHARFKAADSDRANPQYEIDTVAELSLWAAAMRRLWRVAKAAKSLKSLPVTAAVSRFEQDVKVTDLIDFRDAWEHADAYSTGAGNKPLRLINVDVDAWTHAADRMCSAVLRELKPKALPEQPQV
jgi:hypothetical protein